jgi:molecular chaperone DnaK
VADAYGIDFGTTNSVLALANARSVEAVPLDDAIPATWANVGFDRVLPSVVAFESGQPVFGWAAKVRRSGRLEAVKRLFATDDEVVVDGRPLKVETAAAMFFRHIQQRAADCGLATRLDRAVVTIPANSRGLSRYRTKLSAGLAGIEVAALINEPTAAAMAYARGIRQNQRILVFDWGGGTLDVTVLLSYEGAFIEQASKGVQRLGGIDVDELFLAAVLRRVPAAAHWGQADRDVFRLNLERAKIELSTRTAVQVELPGKGYLEVTRAEFDAAVRPLVERTRVPVETCLRDAPGRIDHLVMVGGSAKMPVVRKFISDLVGIEPDEGGDPMTAVAEGAAIAAGILQGTITDLDFYVGTEHALGIVVHNDDSPPDGTFSVLIRRNTKYPARASDAYTPTQDFQKTIRLQVIEGDPDKPIRHEDNVILKDWRIDLPGERLAQDSSFDVTYEYDIDGILQVQVADQRTGRTIMAEEFSFGAALDKSKLPSLHQEVDALMGEHAASSPARSGPALSAASVKAIERARAKVLPFVGDQDRARLDGLITALLDPPPGEEQARCEDLERELRVHAYLL